MSVAIGPGVLVHHRTWGLGKVVHATTEHWIVHFPSLAATEQGPQRRLQAGTDFVRVSESQSDPVLDGVPVESVGPRRPTGRKQPRRPPPPIANGLEQTVAWFLNKYPGRFEDPQLIEHELEYKRRGHQLFLRAFGDGKGRQLIGRGDGSEIAEHLKQLYHATDIPSRFEIMAATDGLDDADAAMRLLESVLRFTERPEADTFQGLVHSVDSLPAPPQGSRVLTWPNVTIVPFLADPTRFMVLKPKISRRMARRMGAIPCDQARTHGPNTSVAGH